MYEEILILPRIPPVFYRKRLRILRVSLTPHARIKCSIHLTRALYIEDNRKRTPTSYTYNT